jgi:hypothetical protein
MIDFHAVAAIEKGTADLPSREKGPKLSGLAAAAVPVLI